MKIKLLSLNLLLLVSLSLSAKVFTPTYYANANGKKGEALKTAMFGIISSHTTLSYKSELLDAYKKTDTRPDGKVRDWYSKTTNYTHITDKAGSYQGEGDVYNREHSVPASWFNEASPMYSDIVHVVPSDGYVNNRRSNYPFGEVVNPTYTSNGGYCKLGPAKSGLGYQGTVFEPGDDVKGDFARIYFYMATCYQSKSPNWGHDVFTGNTYQPLADWAYKMFLRWAKEDPIDDVERARNNAVEDVQGNRNPFVDFEGLEQYIWGTYQNVAFSASNYVNPYGGETPSLQTPTASFALASKTLEVGDTYQQTLTTNSNGAVSYVSSNPDVATVNVRTGLVTALSAGATTITATVDATSTYLSAEASYTIIVTQSGVGPTPEPLPTVAGDYVKVTSAPDDWSGTYLIVYEDNKCVLNGALESIDAANNYITVDIQDNTIADSEAARAAQFVISASGSGYIIKNAKGKCLGAASSSNSLTLSTDNLVHTISLNNNDVSMKSSYGNQLRYNISAKRFRYYKSGQEAIQLYKKVEKILLVGDVNADGSVSVADVTALVNIVLGKTREYNEKMADVNGDGNVSVADVTALVNLVLGKEEE